MAEQILKVSLKDYKKNIDELKATLLALDSESEEYAKTLQQLQQAQKKLNQVNQDAKKDNDALEGSYDALVTQMATLKREWRATNDEAKRNEIGQQIGEINTKLKEFDASIGNYQRNVGNYEGATVSLKQQLKELNETMMNMLASGIKETDPAFVELAKKAGHIKDAMMDAKAATKEYADDVRGMAVGLDVVKNLASGYGAVTSAMHLFGVESKSAQEITAKMTTIMTLLNSLQTINKAINDSASPTRKLLIGLWQQLTGAKTQDTVVTVENTVATEANTAAANAMTAGMVAETAATKAATVATKAFKVALISTGIGAIIVAIGELIAHWSDLTELIKKNTEFLRKLGPQFAALANAIDMTTEAEKKYNAETGNSAAIAERYEKAMDNVESTVKSNVQSFISLQSAWKKLNSQAEKKKFLQEYKGEMQKLGIATDNVNSAEKIFNKNSGTIIKMMIARAQATAGEALMAESLVEYYRALKTFDFEKIAAAGEKRSAAEKMIADSMKLQAKYANDLKNSGITFNNNTTDKGGSNSGNKEDDAKKQAELKSSEAIKKVETEINNLRKDSSKRLEEINHFFDMQLLTVRDTVQIQKYKTWQYREQESILKRMYDNIEKIYSDALSNPLITDEDKKKIQEKLKEVQDAREKSDRDYVYKKEQSEVAMWERIGEIAKQKQKETISKIEKDTAKEIDKINQKYNELNIGGSPEKRSKNDESREVEILNEEIKGYESLIAKVQEYMDEFTEMDKSANKGEYDELNEQLDEYTAKLKEAQTRLQDLTTPNKMGLQKSVQVYGQWANGISSILSSVTQAQQQQLQNEVNSGKISEEAAEKRFEDLKQFQIASTIIDTLAGATANFMLTVADKTIQPTAVRWATAGIMAAQTLAQGYAQIEQIKSTTLNGGGGNLGGSSFQGVAMQPLLNERLDSNSLQNLQIGRLNQMVGQRDDQRVYILETDIQESNKRVQIREDAVTF